MEEPDPRMIRAAAAGDDQAFTDLVRASEGHVWRFLRHLVGDPDLAADLTQETFVRVHRSLAGFRHESRFTTWLFRIARNAAVDEGRRSARRARLLELERAERPTQADPSAGNELRAAMASLPERLREPFVLIEVFGLRYHEAAEVLGVPTGTVKSRMFAARSELVAWYRADRDGLGNDLTDGLTDDLDDGLADDDGTDRRDDRREGGTNG